MKITTHTQLVCFLKSKKINIKDFDYVEGKTTDDFMADHPMIIHGRRFYENPYLWTAVMDMKLNDVVDYLYSLEDLVADTMIIKAAIQTQDMQSKVPMKLIERYLDHADKVGVRIGDEEDESKIDTEFDIDSILENLASIGRMEWFQKVVELATEHNTKPRYGCFANAGNGMSLYYSVTDVCTMKYGDKFAYYLIDEGADVSLNDSITFCLACKYGRYQLAVEMLDHGADLHAKNDLGLKMIMKNDQMVDAKGTAIKLAEDEEMARKILLERYQEDEAKEEQKEATAE